MNPKGTSLRSPPSDPEGTRPLPPPPDPEKARGIRVLIVDDERTIRESCASLLRQYGYTVTTAGSEEDALDVLRRQEVHILLLDLYMKGEGGMSILHQVQGNTPETLTIVMTGKPSVESSIEAFRAGAWDYLSKPFSATQLSILIGRATHTVHINRDSEEVGDEGEEAIERVGQVEVLGESQAFLKAIDLARKVARTDASVFITGASGTGKELVAQLIHEHGRRSHRELVAVNCAALPEGLLESEMFGHMKGAFTGAVQDKPGLLERADGGTLFLDELTEMSLGIQAKLLRAIQDGVVRRVGSTETSALVNVRFIAATNRDPAEAIAEGHLRRDLYYRLRVVPIHLPPLRERPADIPLLARHFLAQFWKKHRLDARGRPPVLTDEALASLRRRRWSGNVRELQNVMEHAVVLLEPGQEVGPEDIPDMDDGVGAPDPGSEGPLTSIDDQLLALPYHEARDRVIATFEEEYLKEIVRRADGNMSKAARMAGVDRTTLYRLMQKHEVSRDQVLES